MSSRGVRLGGARAAGTLGRLAVPLLCCAAIAPNPHSAPSQSSRECDQPNPAWIWCDDFEENRLDRYFEYNRAGGRLARQPAVGVDGSYGLRARWTAAGQVSAGSLHLAFGRTPDPYMRPVDAGDRDYREIYWRVYLRNAPTWRGGGGNKLSRAIVFASAEWAPAALAHVWSGTQAGQRDMLMLDPASGTSPAGAVRTTGYNDFEHLRWLGAQAGVTRVFGPGMIGRWHCIEAHVRLNEPGRRDGAFDLWIDGRLDAGRQGLNWVGAYSGYGLNAVFLENYWNKGAPQPQERYFDRLVVSTERIGC